NTIVGSIPWNIRLCRSVSGKTVRPSCRCRREAPSGGPRISWKLARPERLWHLLAVAGDKLAPPSAPWLAGGLGLIPTWVPFGVAVARAASAGQWRDDLPAVRDLGLVAVGFGGGLSTLVTQALALVPLGPRTFRAALGSAIALAVAARLLYGLVLRTLER